MPPSKSEKVQAVFNRLFWCWLGEFLTDQSAGPIGVGRLQKAYARSFLEILSKVVYADRSAS
jgi:hypothetical protein